MALLTNLISEEHLLILEPYINKAYLNVEKYYTYDEFLYEIIGYYYKCNKNLNNLLTLLYKEQVGFNHPVYDTYKLKEIEEDNFITKPFEVEEGVMECKCGSKKTISFQRQVRSSDEGFTIFCQCVECGNKWREN